MCCWRIEYGNRSVADIENVARHLVALIGWSQYHILAQHQRLVIIKTFNHRHGGNVDGFLLRTAVDDQNAKARHLRHAGADRSLLISIAFWGRSRPDLITLVYRYVMTCPMPMRY
jgi:hypothetical protein